MSARASWVAALAIAASLSVLAVGCRGDDVVSAGNLSQTVLQPHDVPDFQLFDEGRQGRADLPAGERADPARFGRKGGWVARYRRSGSNETRGPLVVESRADLFESAHGADQDLDAHRAELERVAEFVELPDIGDESVAATFAQETAVADFRFYTIAWRKANVAASITVQGFDGKLTLDDASALARKQQRRIENALGA